MSEEFKFEKSLMKTIDEQLMRIFGKKGTSIIYDYMQNALALQQDEIPKRLELFTEGLDKFLSSGAKVVEKVILDDLYTGFGQEFKFKEGYNFADYIQALKATVNKGNNNT